MNVFFFESAKETDQPLIDHKIKGLRIDFLCRNEKMVSPERLELESGNEEKQLRVLSVISV